MQTLPPALPALSDRLADTWVATDALGRPLPTYREVGAPKPNRTVGILYSLALGADSPPGFRHWGEPELGFYSSTEESVLRRHCRMLTNAGVDVLVLELTDTNTYPKAVQALCKVLLELRAEGEKTPQFCFLVHQSTAATVQKLNEEVYQQQLAPELWFPWDGKPLLLAKPAEIPEPLKSQFTLRQSGAWTKGQAWFDIGWGKWPWIDTTPQEQGRTPRGRIEQLSVSVAGSEGRSFHNGKQPPPELWRTDLGLCFTEQWDRALDVLPPFILVNAWNQWVGSSSITPQNTPEYSRDIEPMREGHTDNYYYQLIANIRRYKGARPIPSPSSPKKITVDGDFSDWHGVEPAYWDATQDTSSATDNDFRLCKVARDAQTVSFVAVCNRPILPRTDASSAMVLYLDSDQNARTGWNGYDYRVTQAKLQKWAGKSWVWVCPIPIATNGNRVELAIPRRRIGQEKRVSLDFHWTDGIPSDADSGTFLLAGDSAPDRRFNYRYEEPLPPKGKLK